MIFHFTLLEVKMTTKICTKCNVEKDIEEFSIRSGTAETRISRCKLCEKERTSEYSKKLRSSPYGAYLQQKSNASSRGIEFKLSFEKWLEIWTDSGKFELRGRGIGFYCMCRIGDKGAYEEGNVFIDLCTTNTYAGNIGKIMSIDTRAKISNGNRGKEHSWSKGELNPMHRVEAKAKISAATSGEKHYRQRGNKHTYWILCNI